MDTPLSFSKIYKLFPSMPAKIHQRQTQWNNTLQTILTKIQKSDEQSNLVSHSFWKHMFSKFEKYYFTHDEKMQFLQLIAKLIKVNFGEETVNDQIQFCGESGAKFHKLQNILHFKHKQSLEYFKFMALKMFHNNLQNQLCFPQLKFDLSPQQTETVAAKVRNFCSHDLNAFAFLSLYLQISVKNRISKEPFGKVQEQYVTQLNNLANIYPANNFEVYPQSQSIKLQKMPAYQMIEKYYFENNQTTHFDELKQLIIKKAEDAKRDQHIFEHLVKDICYSKGYGFKSGVKIKSPQNTISIFRTIEKLIEQLLEKKERSQNSNSMESSNSKRINEWKTYSIDELKSLIQDQKQNSFKKIQALLEEQRSIVIDSKDLVRGKCTFSTIQDIVETVKNLFSHIKKQGHEILQVKDRLSKHTKDAVLIIKLPSSIAQLQLVVKLDSVANEFNHKIYELKRSKLYSPITNLFVQNQVWCQNFFTEQYELFEQIYKLNSNFDFEETLKFRDFKFDLQDFKAKFLKPYEIVYLQDQKSKQDEKIQVEQQVKFLVKIMKINEYQNINKTARIKDQKTHQVRFYKDNIDYDKGLELLYLVQTELEQNNTNLLKLKGDIMWQKGNLQQALNCYFKCISLYERGQKSANQSLIYGAVLNQIGLVYSGKGDYASSLEYFQKSLQIKKKIKGQCSIDTAAILNNIGGIYDQKGDYAKALECYGKCLAIKEKINGKESIEVATTLNNIGSVYDSKGIYAKALQYYERCLDIKTKVKGKDSIDVATTLNNIGSVYDNLGNYSKALEYYERCLNIKRKIKGPQSIDVATSLNNIGVVCEHKGDYNLALEHYEQCLNIQIKVKGQKSIDVATTMNNIGLVYTNNANYANASQYFEKCLEIQRNIKGEDSIDVATTLNNVGFVYWKQGNLDKASQHYEKSLRTELKIKGQNSIDVATTLNNIGSVYHTKKDYIRAIENYERCLRIHQNLGQRNSLDVAAILNNIGLVYNDKGDFNKALECFERCLTIKVKSKGEDSIDVATTLNNLSFLHEKMKCIQKAYDCARKSFDIRQKVLGLGHQYTKATQRQLEKMKTLLSRGSQ